MFVVYLGCRPNCDNCSPVPARRVQPLWSKDPWSETTDVPTDHVWHSHEDLTETISLCPVSLSRKSSKACYIVTVTSTVKRSIGFISHKFLEIWNLITVGHVAWTLFRKEAVWKRVPSSCWLGFRKCFQNIANYHFPAVIKNLFQFSWYKKK